MKKSLRFYTKHKKIFNEYQRLVRWENREKDLERKRVYRQNHKKDLALKQKVRREERKLNLKYSEVRLQ